MMKAFEIEDGVTYVVCAKNIRQAIDVYFRTLEGANGLEGVEDTGFEIEPMSEERAKGYEVQLDDGAGEITTVYEELKDAKEAALICCSEY